LRRFLAPLALAAVAACSQAIESRGPSAPILVVVDPSVPVPVPVPVSDSSPQPPARPLVAILIDDMGDSWDQAAPFLDVPAPLAFAVLPDAPAARDVSRRLVAAGRDVLVHVPMEPAEADLVATPGFLTTAQDDTVIQAVLARLLDAVPGAKGVNNHMGSRLTTDATRLDAVMQVLERRGLFFVDSRTTTASVARQAAERAGVPAIDRDVFLDNVAADASIAARMDELVAVAKANGCALGIGHPRPETLTVLARWARGPGPGRDVDLVPVSRLFSPPCRAPGAAADPPGPGAPRPAR
jgi:polysaccharide deacetylase 2 family uncharacterized protein YibQ